MAEPKIELYVNDSVYAGWTEVSVKRSIKAVSGCFDISLNDRWDLTSKPWPLIPGDECQLKIEDQEVISGFVDDVDTEIDANSKRIRVAGRDKTADVVDCSVVHKTGHWNKPIDIVDLATALCEPYGISVSADVDTGEPLPNWDTRPGETVFQNLDRAAKYRGLLIVSDRNGGIVFTRAGQNKAGFQLSYGINLLSVKSKYSQKERFSEYVVSMALGGMDVTAPEFTNKALIWKAGDSQINRFRRLTIVEDGLSTQIPVAERARWEASTRAGKSQVIDVSIVGFTKPNGDLWVENELIPIKIPFLGIDLELLSTDVTYRYSGGGSITDISLTRKDAFELLPLIDNQQDLWNKLARQGAL